MGKWRVLLGVGLLAVIGGAVVGAVVAAADESPVEPSIEDLIRLEGTEAQSRYLADGKVTAAEREAAFMEWAGCMEAQGVEVTSYSLDPRGGEAIDVRSDLPDADENSIVLGCRDEHYDGVSAVYSREYGPTREDDAEEAAQIANCMRDRGVDVPEGAPFERLMAIDPETTLDCYVTVQP